MTADVIDAGDGLPLTVGTLLRERVADDGRKALLVCDDERLTYSEADRWSAALAEEMLGAGLGAGSRVGLLFPNGWAFVVVWLAAARIGAITVPLSTFSTGPELVGLLRGADVTALLATPRYRSNDFVTSLSAPSLSSTDRRERR